MLEDAGFDDVLEDKLEVEAVIELEEGVDKDVLMLAGDGRLVGAMLRNARSACELPDMVAVEQFSARRSCNQY